MKWRELRLDFLAVRLEPRREHEVLAERSRILVDGKTGSIGRELEENPARLEEIDRFEPEAVDDFGRAAACALYAVADL